MREIKFRAWDVYQEIMFYDCDTIRIGLDGLVYFGRDWNGKMTDITTPLLKMMQFTGLKDKNGKEIYEGDIVERESWCGRKEREEVKFGWWGDTLFETDSYGYGMLNWSEENFGKDKLKSIEVIGDIYETPGLIEQPLGNNAEPIRNISEDDWRKDDR